MDRSAEYWNNEPLSWKLYVSLSLKTAQQTVATISDIILIETIYHNLCLKEFCTVRNFDDIR